MPPLWDSEDDGHLIVFQNFHRMVKKFISDGWPLGVRQGVVPEDPHGIGQMANDFSIPSCS
jgi:hypothetical protein